MSLFVKSLKKAGLNNTAEPEIEEEYVDIYVPFEYKNQAKKYGARWNGKNWYTSKSNVDYQKLVDLFHWQNFVTSYYGTKMRYKTSTEKEREQVDMEQTAKYNAERNRRIIEKNGAEWTESDEYKLGAWFSVCVLGHE